MKVVVISPTYNEKKNITKMIPLLLKDIFPSIKKHDMFLLVADDNSPDGTGEIVEEFSKKNKHIVLLRGQKEGLGAAYVRAMQYAMEKLEADAVIEFDSDFQHDPYDIPRLVEAMDEGHDVVIGSRYIPGGQIPKEWALDRKIKSYFGGLFARIVLLAFSIHDITSGFKLTRTSYLKKINLNNLYSKNYAYKIQILYEIMRKGASIKEIPIIFHERVSGKSKMDTNDLLESFIVVCKLRLRDSARFIKFLVVGGTGFLIQLLTQEGSIALGFTKWFALLIGGIVAIFLPHPDVIALSHSIGAAFGAEAAIISNFLINNFWTFKDRRGHITWFTFLRKFVKFNLSSILSILIQFTTVWVGEKLLGPLTSIGSLQVPTRLLIVIPTIIFIIIPLNYIIYSKLIWKRGHVTKV